MELLALCKNQEKLFTLRPIQMLLFSLADQFLHVVNALILFVTSYQLLERQKTSEIICINDFFGGQEGLNTFEYV